MGNTLKLIFTIVLLLFLIPSQGQETGEYSCISEKQKIGTQGKLEDRQAIKFIRKEYIPQNYDPYSGPVKVEDNDTYKYGEEVLIVYNTCKILKNIFQKGIFYPEIITGQVKTGIERKKELELMLFRNDSLTISDFQELRFINKSSKAKIFRFWLYTKGMFNPMVCFIELKNDSATRKTDLETFINGSKLTFFREGWIVL